MPLNIALALLLLEAAGFIVLLSWMRRRVRHVAKQNLTYERERQAIVAFLDTMGGRITSGTDLEGTLEIITEFIVEATEAESGAIFILDEGGEYLTAKSVCGLFPPIHAKIDYVLTRPKHLKASLRHDRVRVGEGIIGRVAEDGHSMLIADAREDPRVESSRGGPVPIDSVMLTPLRTHGRILGVFAVVNKRDEYGTFTESDMNLMTALGDQAAVTVDIFRLYQEMTLKQRIERDLLLARDFQRLLLPTKTPQIPGYDFAAYNETALDIGGDYYDFIQIDDRHLGIVIGDVSGKGIPGALIMAMVRSSVRTEAMRSLSPKETLRHVNERLLEDTSDNVFITMTYGVLDIVAGTLRFARCGHEPTISSNPTTGKMDLHTPDGIALGLVGADMFDIVQEMEIALEPGGLTVLYTDGVIEAMDSDRNEYGQGRLFGIIESHMGTARELVDSVVSDIERFTSGIPQYDDLTMVVIRADARADDDAQPNADAASGPQPDADERLRAADGAS